MKLPTYPAARADILKRLAAEGWDVFWPSPAVTQQYVYKPRARPGVKNPRTMTTPIAYAIAPGFPVAITSWSKTKYTFVKEEVLEHFRVDFRERSIWDYFAARNMHQDIRLVGAFEYIIRSELWAREYSADQRDYDVVS